MRLIVDGTTGTVTAQDADSLNALSVVLLAADAERAATVLADFGRLDGTHVWLNIESLKTFAPQPRSCSWDERFTKTIQYARTQGWTDETGRFVRAHVEDSEA
jgi:hypothetical protein